MIFCRYNIRPSNGMLYQWLNISIRLCSSSDSSDSDSDTEKEKQKTFVKSMEPATSDSGTNLQSFLNKMIEVIYNLLISLIIHYIQNVLFYILSLYKISLK